MIFCTVDIRKGPLTSRIPYWRPRFWFLSIFPFCLCTLAACFFVRSTLPCRVDTYVHELQQHENLPRWSQTQHHSCRLTIEVGGLTWFRFVHPRLAGLVFYKNVYWLSFGVYKHRCPQLGGLLSFFLLFIRKASSCHCLPGLGKSQPHWVDQLMFASVKFYVKMC